MKELSKKQAETCIGKDVVITNCKTRHGFAAGMKVKIVGIDNGRGEFIAEAPDYGRYNVAYSDVQLAFTREMIVQSLKAAKAEVAELEVSLAYMDEKKVDEIDLSELKVYQTLKIYKDENLSDFEKAEMITKLF